MIAHVITDHVNLLLSCWSGREDRVCDGPTMAWRGLLNTGLHELRIQFSQNSAESAGIRYALRVPCEPQSAGLDSPSPPNTRAGPRSVSTGGPVVQELCQPALPGDEEGGAQAAYSDPRGGARAAARRRPLRYARLLPPVAMEGGRTRMDGVLTASHAEDWRANGRDGRPRCGKIHLSGQRIRGGHCKEGGRVGRQQLSATGSRYRRLRRAFVVQPHAPFFAM